MLQLVGENIEALPFQGLKKVADIWEFEATPVLSHFRDDQDNNVFFYWVDFNSEYMRWLVFHVSNSRFEDYISGRITLKQIITEPEIEYFYSVEMGEGVEYENIVKVFKNDVDQQYLPGDKSFYCG